MPRETACDPRLLRAAEEPCPAAACHSRDGNSSRHYRHGLGDLLLLVVIVLLLLDADEDETFPFSLRLRRLCFFAEGLRTVREEKTA